MKWLLFVKRIITNKIFWLALAIEFFLLLCSEIYLDPNTGRKYLFFHLFYNENIKLLLELRKISLASIVLGYDTSYLWMFCSIIVSLCVIMTKNNLRFEMFRMTKKKYVLAKYGATLFSSGFILFLGYFLFVLVCFLLDSNLNFNIYIFKKLVSVFFWGCYSSLFSLVLVEFLNNKYLIVCLPFVLNYFSCVFLVGLINKQIYDYLSFYTYQILFLYDLKTIIIVMFIFWFLVVCLGILKIIVIERRCDCGN